MLLLFVYSSLLVITLWIQSVSCTFYSNDDKVCDPLGNRFTRFTGFKIHRQYVVKDLKPPMLHFVTLSHCEDGVMDYERLTRTGRETDIQWDKTFCMIDPKRLPVSKLISKSDKRDEHVASFSSFESAPKSPHSQRLSIVKRTLKDKFKLLLRKMSSHLSFVEYVDDPLEVDLESLNTVSYDNFTSQDYLDSLTCYKLARRKKYALRELLVYYPRTFVGGMFQCNISEADKIKYLDSLKDRRDFIKPFEFTCDARDAVPLYPLLADHLSHQWIERNKGFTVSQRVPYLYSPGALDFRYGKAANALGLKSSTSLKEHVDNESIDKLAFDSWYKEIEVNENYNFTQGDIGVLTESFTNTVNLFKAFVKINTKYLPWEWDRIELTGNQDSLTYLEHKFLTIVSRIKNDTAVLNYLTSIQRNYWDGISLTPEFFHYNATC